MLCLRVQSSAGWLDLNATEHLLYVTLWSAKRAQIFACELKWVECGLGDGLEL